jgi:quercetin dioxygenase-like cupin family protein
MADKGFFNLHDMSQGIARELAEGITTRIFPGDQAMLSVVRLDPNAEGKMHSHPQEQWGVILEGAAVRLQGDKEFYVRTGDFWRTPGGVPHTIKAGPEGALILDVFAPPRDEYRKAGKGFGDS